MRWILVPSRLLSRAIDRLIGLSARATALVVERHLGMGKIAVGLAEALLVMAVVTCAALLIVIQLPPPPQALLDDLADLGTVLVLAYVVEAAWLVPRIHDEPDYEVRLGALTGIGLAGLAGVVFCMLASAHRAAGHANPLDDLLLAWSVPAVLILAVVVVLQPLLVHDWEIKKRKRNPPEQKDQPPPGKEQPVDKPAAGR